MDSSFPSALERGDPFIKRMGGCCSKSEKPIEKKGESTKNSLHATKEIELNNKASSTSNSSELQKTKTAKKKKQKKKSGTMHFKGKYQLSLVSSPKSNELLKRMWVRKRGK